MKMESLSINVHLKRLIIGTNILKIIHWRNKMTAQIRCRLILERGESLFLILSSNGCEKLYKGMKFTQSEFHHILRSSRNTNIGQFLNGDFTLTFE